MITRITQKQYNSMLEKRKINPDWIKGIIFKGADGHYYKTEKADATAVKEVFQFNKRIKKAKNDQQGLFDQENMLVSD